MNVKTQDAIGNLANVVSKLLVSEDTIYCWDVEGTLLKKLNKCILFCFMERKEVSETQWQNKGNEGWRKYLQRAYTQYKKRGAFLRKIWERKNKFVEKIYKKGSG